MSDTFFLIIGVILAVIGSLLVFSGIRQIVKCSEKAVFTVEKVAVEKAVIRGSTVSFYRPVYSYTANGKKLKILGLSRTPDKNRYSVGDTCTGSFDPSDPSDVRFEKRLFPFPAAAVLITAGAVLIICFFL